MSQIFNSYLLSTTQFDDFDEMADVAAYAWDQRYRKLGKKSDYGFARQLNMPAAQLSHIGWESGIHIETGTPPGSVGIVQQVSGEKRLRMNGQRLENDEIALLPPTFGSRKFDFNSASHLDYDRRGTCTVRYSAVSSITVRAASISMLPETKTKTITGSTVARTTS